MPTHSILVTTCATFYGLSAILLWRNAKSETTKDSTQKQVTGLTCMAIILHGYLMYDTVFIDGGPRISLGLAISMAGMISALLYLAISIKTKLSELGIIVLPISLLAVLVGAINTGNTYSADTVSAGVGWHIIFAIPTYAIMCVAFAQACLLIIQDRQLHNARGGVFLPTLPPIQTMESTLTGLTLLGFVFMTLNLVVGMVSSMNYYGAVMVLNHHILLSFIAWIAFGSLLLGRKVAGWRGEIAAKWTIISFLILFLAYFGTRFVNEVVLTG